MMRQEIELYLVFVEKLPECTLSDTAPSSTQTSAEKYCSNIKEQAKTATTIEKQQQQK